MNWNSYTLSIIVAFLIAGCLSKRAAAPFVSPVLVAWNEDTVNSYQLSLYSNNNFNYSVITRQADNTRFTKSYQGNFRFAEDSILLNFNKDHNTEALLPYLIKEVSGNYLIQYFKNNSRMFLRIQNRHWYR